MRTKEYDVAVWYLCYGTVNVEAETRVDAEEKALDVLQRRGEEAISEIERRRAGVV